MLGRSIGSGPAVHLASENLVEALILVSPYKSISDIIKDFSNDWLKNVSNFFPNIDKINKVNAKTILIHGGRDDLIKPYHTDDLLNELKRNKHGYTHDHFKKVILQDCDHNDIAMHSDLINVIQSFIFSLNVGNLS